jgi:hypothetical protein
MSYDKPKKPSERFSTHISNIGAMQRAFADAGTPLISKPDKNKMVHVQIVRYAQPGGHIRKAIKETFG